MDEHISIRQNAKDFIASFTQSHTIDWVHHSDLLNTPLVRIFDLNRYPSLSESRSVLPDGMAVLTLLPDFLWKIARR